MTAEAYAQRIFCDLPLLICCMRTGKGSGTSTDDRRPQVELDIVVADVAVPASGAGYVSLTQAFSVKWLPSSATARPQVFSGNPGYLPGYPVLVRQTEAACTDAMLTMALMQLLAGLVRYFCVGYVPGCSELQNFSEPPYIRQANRCKSLRLSVSANEYGPAA